MTAKTHRERAEEAANALRPHPPIVVVRDGAVMAHEAVARHTYPTELVKAARTMRQTFCDSHEFCMDDPDGLLPRSHHPDCIALRAALALYDQEPA